MVDTANRPVQVSVPGVAPLVMSYDTHGHLLTTTQNGRVWSRTYDALGNLSSATDPLGHVTQYLNRRRSGPAGHYHAG